MQFFVFPIQKSKATGLCLKIAPYPASSAKHILKAWRETNGVIGGPHGAAAWLGVKRTTLLYKMRLLGITRP
jgi:formate hydrogenlyase transcriptional activator